MMTLPVFILAALATPAIQALPPKVAMPAVPAGSAMATGKDGDVIVVTARRYEDMKAALAACIARGCPPDEEMIAWMRQADAQFLTGDYLGARGTVVEGRKRNARYAKQFPVQLGEMWRMDGKLASLMGKRGATWIAARGAADVLRAGLPQNDPRIFVQQLEVGDAFAMDSRVEYAEGMYRQVARDAANAGETLVEGRAMLRLAILYSALANRQSEYIGTARRALDAIDARGDDALAPVREAAIVVRAKLDLALDPSGNSERTRAALARLPRTEMPVLIYAPPLDTGLRGYRSNTVLDYALASQGGNGAIGTTLIGLNYDLEHQWADVSYRIAPDGSVQDLSVIRQGDGKVDDWLKGIREGLAKRRYAPFVSKGDGVYRIERYSLVSDLRTSAGTHIALRSSAPHVEVTDLTASRIGLANRD